MQSSTKLWLWLLLGSLINLCPNFIQANNPWNLVPEDEINVEHLNRQIIPDHYQTFHLDLDQLASILAEAPLRASSEQQKRQVLLEIPMPDGTMERFQIMEAPIMHPDLASKYPMLRAYVGTGIDDPTASLRFDVTPFGFHGMILSGRHGGVYIDPYAEEDIQHYITYFQRDYKKDVQYECHFVDDETTFPSPVLDANKNLQGDCMLRTYRLALACTGEYAAFHGGNIPDVMSAFHTTMTRVNGIFERDVAITMELIANTDDLIFLDGTTDPYNFEFPIENQAVCDDIIGTENYDIGHVLGVGAGGAAERSSCCVEGLKAEGYSTLSNPVGDGFDINFVAHEFGHQFGCSHTANGNCNNTPSTSVEPGNAFSVMGQDFFCDPIIEPVRGAYFHAVNILEIALNVTDGPPGSCASLTDLGNTPPSVDGGDPHYHLPISTPFKLTATGTDVDGDVLTYNWEQMDNEEVIDPPIPTNAAGPAFRSYEPAEESYRYFPSLEYIVNGTDYLWEVLPSVSRPMNFRVTARDNFMGGGCTAEDDVDLTFTEKAGPFLVLSPNGNETWYQGASYTVSWDVANTDKAPVACADVDILLSIDGGYTYPIDLAPEATNDGAWVIEVPEVTTTMARIMIVCSDNIFFDISDENFTIEAASSPTFTMALDPIFQEVCGLEESGEFIMNFSALAGFDEEITLSATGLPSGASLNFGQNPINVPNWVPGEVEGLENVPSGDYTINIVGTAASMTIEQELVIRVNNEVPEQVNLMAPSNGADLGTLRPTFDWEAGFNTLEYTLEIASNPDFENNLITSITTNDDQYTLEDELEPLRVYYWRVIPINNCGEGEVAVSNFYAFRTSGNICKNFENIEPSFIPGFLASTSTTINVEESFEITDVNLSMELFHKMVGDLKATLTAPSGLTVELFDRPGIPEFEPFGCTRDDLLVSFDDEAVNTATDFENTCETGTDYAIEGAFQPIDALSQFDGQSTLGEWTLTVMDEKFSHAGAVDSWSLEFCLEEEAGAIPDFTKMDLFVDDLGTETISSINLLTTSTTAGPTQISYTLTVLPTAGTLFYNGETAEIGSTFTQQNIDNDLLSYVNTNPDVSTDQFRFDIQTIDGNWIHDAFLDIKIGDMTGIKVPIDLLDFDLFPNPASEQISVIFDQANTQSLKIMIFDPIGQLLKEIQLGERGIRRQLEIDLRNFPAGIYFLQLTDGVAFNTKKFIKN